MNQVIDECVSGTEKDITGKRLMHVFVNVTLSQSIDNFGDKQSFQSAGGC